MAELRDDGTMDTVVRCPNCGHEERYNYQGSEEAEGATYDSFAQRCINEFETDHDCNEETDEEPRMGRGQLHDAPEDEEDR